MRILSLVFVMCTVGSVACITAKTGDGADAGSGPAATGDGGAAAVKALGAGCGIEVTTNTQLCTAISVCPKIAVDHDVFPHCGFRLHGDSLDLECACNGALCPLGSPATCDQAAKLLQGQTELQVCAQVNEGRCTAGTPAPATTGPSTTNPCDKACASECGGNPQCLKDCGC